MEPVAEEGRHVDLSQIDFEALREKFDKGRKTVEVQKLRADLTFKLARMIQLNRTRLDYLEEFQRMVDEYNSGAINVQIFFNKQQTTRAGVLTTIKEVLDELPRAYTTELYEQKCDSVYQHFYDAYAGQGKSLYSS